MSAYMHMGHDTENLVGATDLEEYQGLILSPINREPEKLHAYLTRFRGAGNYDIMFDSQLYFPRSLRGHLHLYKYYPSDIDTADLSSETWWDTICEHISQYILSLNVDAVVSPVLCPKVYSDDYYSVCANSSNKLSECLKGRGIRVLTTVMVNIDHLSDPRNPLNIASIISKFTSNGYYVVIDNGTIPRREFSNAQELVGIMQLIHELASTKLPVLVSHCSSDMLLYKVAGASDCATGKFFNLRRFTKSRYDETPEGGGQLPYWFEHSLLAFLREADILRLQAEHLEELVGMLHSGNYWGQQILANLQSGKAKPWIAMGWRQYLSWFAKAELSLSKGDSINLVNNWLKSAEANWLKLEDNGVLMEEPRNDGAWLRPWRLALNKFLKDNSMKN